MDIPWKPMFSLVSLVIGLAAPQAWRAHSPSSGRRVGRAAELAAADDARRDGSDAEERDRGRRRDHEEGKQRAERRAGRMSMLARAAP